MKLPRRARRLLPLLLAVAGIWCGPAAAQPHLASPERVRLYTQEWEGDRDRFGRPIVSDHLLEQMKYVGIEEAWSALREAGYHNQLEAGWEILHPDRVMVGRALTTAFLPRRPELDARLIAMGRDMGLGGATNQWPMELLVPGDVIVVDHWGKPAEGAFLGDNLAQAIHTNSRNGAVIYGQARDITGVRGIAGFNTWVKAWHPSASNERMLASINEIIRVGEAVVLPGDVVLATEGGIVFIPPHLAERVIASSEVTRLVDAFRIESMRDGRYSSQQVYSTDWTTPIEDDFFRWLMSERARLLTEYHTRPEAIDGMLRTRSRDWRNW